MSDDNPGALLTPSMREFYEETPDETGSKARSVRQRTRDRLSAGFADINLLYMRLRDDDLRSVIDQHDKEFIEETISNFIGIFAREIDTGRFEEIVQRGLERGLEKSGYAGSQVTVNIEMSPIHDRVEHIVKNIESDEQIEMEDLAFLMSTDPENLTEEQLKKLEEVDAIPEGWNIGHLKEGEDWEYF